ncbi:MAG: hypothetical protein KDA84_27665 [Planctomycetaceae bacterium]|nr:hypothetical protein [Planctomycetaceae bacterium]
MQWLKSLWVDEMGSVLTAEAVLLSTMGVVGATVGLNMASDSVDQELRDVAHSLRHLDQSYEVAGHSSCRAKTAGSSFQQEDVKKSIQRLDKVERELEAEYKKQQKALEKHEEELLQKLRRQAEQERRKAEEEERKGRNTKKKLRKPGDDDDDD